MDINKVLSEDEPSLLMKLFGFNEVLYVEMWGWTNTIPLGFPTLKKNLELKTLNSEEHYQELINVHAIKLETLAKYAPCEEYSPINVPVVVQVVAKKKVDVIYKEKKKEIILLGQLLVADETGVCLIALFNETVSIVHDRLKIGDTLVIKGGKYRPIEKCNLQFRHRFYDHLLNLEITVDKYSVRHNQIVTLPIPVLGKFHDYLFAHSSERIWTPSDIVDDVGQRFQQEERYFDVIGVVSFVGRVERTSFKTLNNECLVNVIQEVSYGEKETIKGTRCIQSVVQYVAYRWIQLVDCRKKTKYVKLYLKKDFVRPFGENENEKQSKLVPGVIVLLTNCCVQKSNIFESYISGSVYTTV